jgi:hypothetical protein
MNNFRSITCLDPADEPMLSPQARRFWNSLNDQLEINPSEHSANSPSMNNPCASLNAVVLTAAEAQDCQRRRLAAIHPCDILDAG